MSNVNFTGWVISDADNVLSRVVTAADGSVCDHCGSPARYFVVVPYAGGGSYFCQDALSSSYVDPRSPDTFFSPSDPR